MLVSPIWHGRRAFAFICMGHVEFCEALGFEAYRATTALRLIKPNTKQQLKRMVEAGLLRRDRFEAQFEKLRNMKRGTGQMLGGGCFGPLTVVSDLLGAREMLKMTITDPDFLHWLLRYVTSVMITLARMEAQTDIDYFWLAEPVASLLSPQESWIFSGRYIKDIYDSINIPGFLHVCGKTLKHTGHLVRTGAQVLSIDSLTPMDQCLEAAGDDVILMGNLDTSLLRFGSREEVREACARFRFLCRGNRNVIFSTGCAVMEGTPEENVFEMFDESEMMHTL